MKKLLILIYALLITHTAYAINEPSQYPKELQELGLYIDSTLDKIKGGVLKSMLAIEANKKSMLSSLIL